jgi:heat shock protein HslJ
MRPLILLSATALAAPAYAEIMAPSSFDGVIPCADCLGIRLTVTLEEDRSFTLRRTYLRSDGRPDSFHSRGRWRLEDGGQRLVLQEVAEAPRQFSVGDQTIRLLDTQGRPIHSESNYDLRQLPEVVRFDDTMRLEGMYQYMADAGRFTECATGLSYPVAQVARNAELEREYIKVRTKPGEPVLVTLLGHFQDGQLVVDAPLRFQPGASCAAGGATTTLTGSWLLTELDGMPVPRTEGPRPAQLNFAEDRFTGYAGCNQFGGEYEASEASLRFGSVIATRMACAGEVMQREGALSKALQDVDSFAIRADTLELLSGGEVRARLRKQ